MFSFQDKNKIFMIFFLHLSYTRLQWRFISKF